MTDNPRPETKHEKFERLRDQRLPKITHAMDILANLGSSGYESSDRERVAVVDELQAAVDAVRAAYHITARQTQEPVPPPEPAAPKVEHNADDVNPNDVAEGGTLARHEIAWAHDAVQRGDKKLALNRLKRVIDMWRN